MRMAASTAPGRKEVFLGAIFRIVSRIQKPVVGYRDGTYACSGAEASVIVSFDGRSVAHITEPGLRHIAPGGATKRLLCGVEVRLGVPAMRRSRS